VIEDADQIKVILANDKEFDAELVGRDSKTDLALIRIKGAKELVPLPLGDSEDLKVGTWVVAIGSPFGLEQTVTAGIVSAKGRIIGSGPYDDFIQTDASINPGNSGGPLLNMDGKVVGINTAIIASGQGIGFAIPINLARGIIDQLKDKGEVTRGWLGVGIQDLTPELADYYGLKADTGVLVTQVFEGDPADNAGIKVNDVILRVDDKPVSTGRELSSMIANTPVGHKTRIELIRDGRQKKPCRSLWPNGMMTKKACSPRAGITKKWASRSPISIPISRAGSVSMTMRPVFWLPISKTVAWPRRPMCDPVTSSKRSIVRRLRTAATLPG